MKMFTKSIIAFFACVCIAQAMSAQTVGKSAWMVGGSAAFDIAKIKDVDGTSSTFLLDPNLGYFFADDLAIGLEFLYNKTTDLDATTAVGPFIRYYVTDPIFIQANVAIDLSKNSGDPVFGGEVGYSWFLNNGLAIEPAVYFNTGNSITHFGLSIGVQGFANHDHGME